MDKNMDKGLEKICKAKEDLLCWVEKEIECGMCSADIEKLGEVVDMVKDLAEAEKCCVEAQEKKAKKLYYCTLVRAMNEDPEFEDDGEMLDEIERYGYDNYRYKTTGRFAPTGHGTRSGYSTKGNPRGPVVSGGNQMNRGSNRMGYPDPMIPMNPNDPWSQEYGKEGMGPWYYHEGEEKHHMTQEEKMRHTMDNMKEMWRDADPALKREMKSDMSNLLNDIPV